MKQYVQDHHIALYGEIAWREDKSCSLARIACIALHEQNTSVITAPPQWITANASRIPRSWIVFLFAPARDKPADRSARFVNG
jgi:hypothetical protein